MLVEVRLYWMRWVEADWGWMRDIQVILDWEWFCEFGQTAIQDPIDL